MCVGCILEIALFKVRSRRDILMETVFNVDHWYLSVLNLTKRAYLAGQFSEAVTHKARVRAHS